MSTLGKVLLFVNLLAAGGLVYLTTQDWSKRQFINAIVLRYHLTLNGFPTEAVKSDDSDPDTVPIDVPTPSGASIQAIGTKLLKTHFQGGDGGPLYGEQTPPKSIVDEFTRVSNKVLSELDGKPDDAAKLAFLVGVYDKGAFVPGKLLHLAESFEERYAVRSLYKFATPEQLKSNLENARQRLMDKIDAVKNPPKPKEMDAITEQVKALKAKIDEKPTDQKSKDALAAVAAAGNPGFSRDDGDRRRRAAQFLMLQDTSAAWQKRVMLVVGLRTYLTAVTEQTAKLDNVTRRVERAFELDQAAFEDEYELLRKLALEQDLLVTQQVRIVAGLTEQEAADDTIRKKRETQLTDLQTALAKLNDDVAAYLAKQSKAEDALFNVQKRVGETLKSNLDLEQTLDAAERKAK